MSFIRAPNVVLDVNDEDAIPYSYRKMSLEFSELNGPGPWSSCSQPEKKDGDENNRLQRLEGENLAAQQPV